jgi:uncharacterized metal-binding protein YceD (DUF177 family)
MENLTDYIIQFVQLGNGSHQFDYQLEETFFANFENTSINKASISASVTLYKEQPNMFNLFFSIEGTVKAECDRCLDEFDLPVQNTFDLLVKQTDKDKENEFDITYIPYSEYQFNIAKYLFDICLLAIPITKKCEDSIEKSCNPVVVEKLKELDINNQSKESDPRWEELKKLINNKDK